MNYKYLFRSALTLPLLPILYVQGKRIRASVPSMPEARGPSGWYTESSSSEEPLELITLGESTIAGVGVETHREGFTGTLAAELGQRLKRKVAWKVYARSGYTARRVVQKLLPRITETSADLIVVGLGGNDAFTLNSPANWRRDINELISALRKRFPSATIIFCNMPPIKEFPAFTPLIRFVVGDLVQLLGAELDQLVREYDNVFFKSETITLKEWIKKFGLSVHPSEFFSDGVHPSKLTYQIWARDVALSTIGYLQSH